MYYLSFRDKVELEEKGKTSTWGPEGERVTLFSNLAKAVDAYKQHTVDKSKGTNVWMIGIDENSWAVIEASEPISAQTGWNIVAGKLRKRLERIALQR